VILLFCSNIIAHFALRGELCYKISVYYVC